MPDAELIENISVVDGNVADHQIGLDNEREHVFADIAGVDDLTSCSPAEPGVLERRGDQLRVDLLEVNRSTGGIRLLTEGTDNKSPLHLRSPCPFGRFTSGRKSLCQ